MIVAPELITKDPKMILIKKLKFAVNKEVHNYYLVIKSILIQAQISIRHA